MEPETLPAPRARAGFLLLYLAAAFVVSTLSVRYVWPAVFGQLPPAPWQLPVASVVFFVMLGTLMTYEVVRTGTHSWRTIIGPSPDPATTQWAITAGFALCGISIGIFFAVFTPLSYFAPGFVQWWLIDDPTVMIWTDGHLHLWANIATFLLATLVAPVIEEIFFRSLLLRAWSERLGVIRAATRTTILFAILHVDMVGALLFGAVLAVVFVRTKSLWIPIIMHVTNNAIAWTLAAGAVVLTGDSQPTLADFQGLWWLGIAGFACGLPLAILALRRMPVQHGSRGGAAASTCSSV